MEIQLLVRIVNFDLLSMSGMKDVGYLSCVVNKLTSLFFNRKP
jgi:hypothetical protein